MSQSAPPTRDPRRQPEHQTHLARIRRLYDSRSVQYDANAVHVQQAADYVRWANPLAGQRVLDLACGTGLVALAAKKHVGPAGCVVGVDISDGMLEVARRKAAAQNVAVAFVACDIADADELGRARRGTDHGSQQAQPFDIITCASALILLRDPVTAVRAWRALLEPTCGRLVVDVQTHDANVVMNIFAAIAPRLGQTVPWDARRWRSMADLEAVVREAGMRVVDLFETGSYATTQYDVAMASRLFDEAVAKPMFENFGLDAIRHRAKALFVDEFTELAGATGSITEECRYWVIVGSAS